MYRELEQLRETRAVMRHRSYTLSAPERVLARTVGEARHNRARANQIPDAREAEDAIFIDINGAAGEIALAGLLYKAEVYSKDAWEEALNSIANAQDVSAAQGTDNGDLLVEGLRIDVKTTPYRDGKLWLHARKLRSPIDYFSLMIGDYNYGSFIYRGSLSAEDARARFQAVRGQYLQSELTELPFIAPKTNAEALRYFNR